VTERMTGHGVVAAATAALSVTTAFPLTGSGSPWWSVACLAVAGVAIAMDPASRLQGISRVVQAASCAALVRIPMQGVYDSGESVPLAARSAAWLLARGWNAWSHEGRLALEGPDGVVTLSCDGNSLGLWEALSIIGAVGLASHRQQRPWTAARATLLAAGAWGLVALLRFVVLAGWYAGEPGVLVPGQVSGLRVFWSPATVVIPFVFASITLGWILDSRTGEVCR
jgi:hypothetical protein